MGGLDFVVGCVGKSTFFNAATEGSSAKVGNYPFTTIKPNEGIGYFVCACPCTNSSSSPSSAHSAAAAGPHSSSNNASLAGAAAAISNAEAAAGGLLPPTAAAAALPSGRRRGLGAAASLTAASAAPSASAAASAAACSPSAAATAAFCSGDGGKGRLGSSSNSSSKCCPRYGRCVGGRRFVPVKLLDVAGLVPEAHAGRGLGNKFLDDLRQADVLIHVIDVSGTTNEKGEATIGYDASRDHEWLLEEIELWIFNNIWSRWSSIARKHRVLDAPLATTFGQQLSGYGAPQALVENVIAAFVKQQQQQQRQSQRQPQQQLRKPKIVAAAAAAPGAAAAPPGAAAATGAAAGAAAGEAALAKMLATALEEEASAEDSARSSNWQRDLLSWDRDRVMMLVREFVKQRFPFVLLMNKCDMGGDADRNVMRISEKFPDRPVIVCSALAECYLQRMKQQKYVLYEEGDGSFYTRQDAEGPFCMLDEETKEKLQQLKPLDEKNAARLEKIKDMVIYRYGSTGVHEALRAAVAKLGKRVPVFPVREWPQPSSSSSKRQNIYSECLLVPSGTTMKEFAGMLHSAVERNFLYAEAPDGRRMKDSEPLTAANNIVRIVTDAAGT